MSDGVMIFLIYMLAIVLPVLIVFFVVVLKKKIRNKKKKLYTEETTGRVVELIDRGVDFPSLLCVAYEVNGIHYEIKESLKLKSEAIKLGLIPIGQIKVPMIDSVEKGAPVTVRYSKENPKNAIILENEGVITG